MAIEMLGELRHRCVGCGGICHGSVVAVAVEEADAVGAYAAELEIPDAVVGGVLSRIAPQAIEKDNAKLFQVELELDVTDQVVLRAGYSANADLIIREKKDILLVPERLVLFEDDGAKTFVELPGSGPEAEPEKVEVVTGLSDGLNIEVVDGLKEGDQVVERPPRDVLG